MNSDEIAELFRQEVKIEGNPNLREPQVGGWLAARAHFSSSNEHAILQIPVGCGKTGLMAMLPFGIANGRVLVIAPNVEIRRRIVADLDVASPDCFWNKAGLLRDLRRAPFVAELDGPDANVHDCQESPIVVTNIQQLASRADRWLPAFAEDFFDMILVDEGHHNVAPSWQRVFERFPSAKVASLTATPFRADGVQVEGVRIYAYPFGEAMRRGYIKKITAVNVAPTEIYFTYQDDDHHHSLAEVLELREEQWFSKGVALAPECNRHIVDASIQYLDFLRESGTPHQLIAVACSVDHARQIRSLYEERGRAAREIYSQMSEDERADALLDLRNGRIDAIVQVRMLGEGFDHPLLSVAAIFNPFRSLSPYIQFVGRIMRVIHQNAPNHPDNEGFIVSHVGLNIDQHWDDFRQIDEEDQATIHGWLEAEPEASEPPAGERRGRRRLTPDMAVHQEIIERFFQEGFLDEQEDEAVIEDLLRELEARGLDPESLGLTREELRRRVQAQRKRSALTPAEIPVSPQRKRQELRRRLAEQSRTLANRVLKDVGGAPTSRKFCLLYPQLRAANDLALVTQLINADLNDVMEAGPGTRGDLDVETLERGVAALEEVGERMARQLQARLSEAEG